MKHAVQLYNFREELKQDFRGALKEIAKLGFEGVEFAAYYGGVAPDELAAYLKELKLECAGTMFSADELLDAGNIAYQYMNALHSPAVTISASCDFAKEWANVAETCRKIGRNAKQNGGVFSYHNHWREFALADGEPAMYRILDSTDASEVFMEPDVCWITRGGYDPAGFLRRYAGRIRQVHLKDSKVPEDRAQLTELGCGVVDLKGAYQAAKEIGVQWAIYEQDVCSDTFRSAEISIKYMQQLKEGKA